MKFRRRLEDSWLEEVISDSYSERLVVEKTGRKERGKVVIG